MPAFAVALGDSDYRKAHTNKYSLPQECFAGRDLSRDTTNSICLQNISSDRFLDTEDRTFFRNRRSARPPTTDRRNENRHIAIIGHRIDKFIDRLIEGCRQCKSDGCYLHLVGQRMSKVYKVLASGVKPRVWPFNSRKLQLPER